MEIEARHRLPTKRRLFVQTKALHLDLDTLTPHELVVYDFLCQYLSSTIENHYTLYQTRAYTRKTTEVSLWAWLEENEIRLNERIGVLAAGRANCPAVLKWLNNYNFPLAANVMAEAAAFGHRQTVIWLHEHQVPWDERTCRNAAESNHLDILQYAHYLGCPWDEKTTKHAANTEILTWARDHGCPVANVGLFQAIQTGDIDSLEVIWSSDNTYPWYANLGDLAINSKQPRVIHWLYQHNLLSVEQTVNYQAILVTRVSLRG
jgi:hypothetical protein